MLEKDIEIIGMPKDGEFKVVQLFFDDKPVMVCGGMWEYHKDLLKDYLGLMGVEPEIDEIPFEEYIKRLPKLEGERYRVVGMGCAGIYPPNFFQLPYGRSADYQISADEEFKERLKQQFEGWEF